MSIGQLLYQLSVESGEVPPPPVEQELYVSPMEANLFNKELAEYHQVQSTMESVQLLTKGFFGNSATVTAETARLFHVSVEAVIRSSGLNIPVSSIAPSLESLDNYSVETDEKKVGLLTRFWRWIVKVTRSLIDRLKKMFTSTKWIFANVERDLTEMKTMLERIRSEGRAVKDYGTPLNHNAHYFVYDKHGKFKTPVAVANDVADALKFLGNIETWFSELSRIHDIAKEMTPEGLLKHIGVDEGREIRVFEGAVGKFDRVARLTVRQGDSIKPQTGQEALSVDDMLEIVTHLLKLIDEPRTIGKRMAHTLEVFNKKAQEEQDNANARMEEALRENDMAKFDAWVKDSGPAISRTILDLGGAVTEILHLIRTYEIEWTGELQRMIIRYEVPEKASDKTKSNEEA